MQRRTVPLSDQSLLMTSMQKAGPKPQKAVIPPAPSFIFSLAGTCLFAENNFNTNVGKIQRKECKAKYVCVNKKCEVSKD